MTVSVYESALGNYNSRPVWEWSISGFDEVKSLSVYLNNIEQTPTLSPDTRFYRPAKDLAAGQYTLTVKVELNDILNTQIESSSVAVINELPELANPNDPYYSNQWGLELMKFPKVWQAFSSGILPSQNEVVVAIIDTGYLKHPDLEQNIDTTSGYDFVSQIAMAADGDGIDSDASDPGDGGPEMSSNNSWHGTSIAGIIAASTNNNSDLAGITWPWGSSKISIMPIRALGVGGGRSYDVAQAILYASGLSNESGVLPLSKAKIINLSLSDNSSASTDPVLQTALYLATDSGTIIVAASGNNGHSVGTPANSDYTIAVGSITSNESLSSYSNQGTELDFVAPGGDTNIQPSSSISTLSASTVSGPPNWTIKEQTGTSFSAAHVSGALALLATIDTTINLRTAKNILADSAIDLGQAGKDSSFGYGLIDAYAMFGSYPVREIAEINTLQRITDKFIYIASEINPPINADPTSLIVRWTENNVLNNQYSLISDLQSKSSIINISKGNGVFSLVELKTNQKREQIKKELQKSNLIAAVYYNRIYQ